MSTDRRGATPHRASDDVLRWAVCLVGLLTQAALGGAQPSTRQLDPAGERKEWDLSLGLQAVPVRGYSGLPATLTIGVRWAAMPGTSVRLFGSLIRSDVRAHWEETQYDFVHLPFTSKRVTVERHAAETLPAIGAALASEYALRRAWRLSLAAGVAAVPTHRIAWQKDTTSGSSTYSGLMALLAVRARHKRLFIEQSGLVMIGSRGSHDPRVYAPLSVGVIF